MFIVLPKKKKKTGIDYKSLNKVSLSSAREGRLGTVPSCTTVQSVNLEKAVAARLRDLPCSLVVIISCNV